MSNKQLIKTLGIGLAAASAGEPAPKDKPSEHTDLKEAVTWAVVSGIGAGVARMAVHYVLDKRKSK